ncbi:MAG: tetratricopeptide repeat protein [Planctomycetaceae bacterium]|nr:tetratricopeptide repeat protein [Planctomycetaceae bacterium]
MLLVRVRLPSCVGLVLVALCVATAFAADDLLNQAQDAFAAGNHAQAIELVSRAITANAQDQRAFVLRGRMHAAMKQPQAAVDDFTKAISLAPSARLFDLRGAEQFKLARINESIADFDAAIKLSPDLERQHWMRGISYYYAGEYDRGRKQFEVYQTFDDNDVENAVWRFLCMARGVGLDEARSSILKIKRDMRVPMMEVYDLFAGKLTVDDVLKAVEAGEPSADELYKRRFYAHLYLGLYYDATGKLAKAREHIALAADKYPIGHYMADVARVHKQLLAK